MMPPPVSQRCPFKILEELCHTDDAILSMSQSSSHALYTLDAVGVFFKGRVPDDSGVFELRSNQAGVDDLPALEGASQRFRLMKPSR